MESKRKDLIPKFTVKVNPDGIIARVGQEMEEQDIIELLSFSEDRLDEILETHAGNQAYWEALAVKLKGKQKEFEDTWCKKWWAHNKTYARYVLIGYGDTKPSVESIKDVVVSIYSEGTSECERDKFLSIAYNIAQKKVSVDYSKEEFKQDMFKYIVLDAPWYFESVIRTLNKLEEDYEIVKIVAKNLYARSFHIAELINLVKPKKSNEGPMSVSERELMDSTSNYGRKKNEV